MHKYIGLMGQQKEPKFPALTSHLGWQRTEGDLHIEAAMNEIDAGGDMIFQKLQDLLDKLPHEVETGTCKVCAL